MNYIKSTSNGFERLDFEFEGRNATLVCPESATPDKKWLYKIEYFDAFSSFEIEMLTKGYFVAGLTNKSRLCPEEDTDMRPLFCQFLKKEFGLNEKCLPVGMSCGGMQAVYFAAKYAEYIAALYLDAPVLNLLSWPLGLGESKFPSVDEFNRDIGTSLSDMINYRNHPIDQKEKLLKSEIPIFLVCGGSDSVVPYSENGKLLSDYFRENGGNLNEILKPDCDHHPHGLEDLTPLIEFAKKYY
jgi:pimeloyl-ACP methyl ester carboxylesterase